MDCISSHRFGASEFYVIVSNIISMLASHSDFDIKFARRQANMVAHTLARAAYSWSSHHVFEICPPCTKPLLTNDIS